MTRCFFNHTSKIQSSIKPMIYNSECTKSQCITIIIVAFNEPLTSWISIADEKGNSEKPTYKLKLVVSNKLLACWISMTDQEGNLEQPKYDLKLVVSNKLLARWISIADEKWNLEQPTLEINLVVVSNKLLARWISIPDKKTFVFIDEQRILLDRDFFL